MLSYTFYEFRDDSLCNIRLCIKRIVSINDLNYFINNIIRHHIHWNYLLLLCILILGLIKIIFIIPTSISFDSWILYDVDGRFLKQNPKLESIFYVCIETIEMNNHVFGYSWSTRLTCKNGKCKLLGCIHVVSTYVYSTLWTYVTHASEVKFIKKNFRACTAFSIMHYKWLCKNAKFAKCSCSPLKLIEMNLVRGVKKQWITFIKNQ